MVTIASIGDGTPEEDYEARLRLTSTAIALLSQEDAFAKYDAFLVASFSDHPLTKALKSRTSKPVTDVFHASINFARTCVRNDGFFGLVGMGSTRGGHGLMVSALEFIGRDPQFARAVCTGYHTADIYLDEYRTRVIHATATAVRDLVWDKYYPCEVVVLGVGCNILKKEVMEAVGDHVVVIDSYSAGLNELAGIIHSLAC